MILFFAKVFDVIATSFLLRWAFASGLQCQPRPYLQHTTTHVYIFGGLYARMHVACLASSLKCYRGVHTFLVQAFSWFFFKGEDRNGTTGNII